MDKYKKFLATLDRKTRKRVEDVLLAIGKNRLEGLDIRPLKGYKNCYRCRTGAIRILFMRSGNETIIIDIGFRAGIYKSL